MKETLKNDRELAEAIDVLDEMIDDNVDMDDPLFVELSDMIEEYEARTDILNRPGIRFADLMDPPRN